MKKGGYDYPPTDDPLLDDEAIGRALPDGFRPIETPDGATAERVPKLEGEDLEAVKNFYELTRRFSEAQVSSLPKEKGEGKLTAEFKTNYEPLSRQALIDYFKKLGVDVGDMPELGAGDVDNEELIGKLIHFNLAYGVPFGRHPTGTFEQTTLVETFGNLEHLEKVPPEGHQMELMTFLSAHEMHHATVSWYFDMDRIKALVAEVGDGVPTKDQLFACYTWPSGLLNVFPDRDAEGRIIKDRYHLGGSSIEEAATVVTSYRAFKSIVEKNPGKFPAFEQMWAHLSDDEENPIECALIQKPEASDPPYGSEERIASPWYIYKLDIMLFKKVSSVFDKKTKGGVKFDVLLQKARLLGGYGALKKSMAEVFGPQLTEAILELNVSNKISGEEEKLLKIFERVKGFDT